MEVDPFPIFFKGNGRTGTFHHNTPHSNEQRFYPRPFNVSIDGVGKYGFKGFPVFANHRRMITQYDIMSTLFKIPILPILPYGEFLSALWAGEFE